MCTRSMRDFVVVELGAGWGRWSLDTIFLAKRLGIRARAICVEAGKRPLLSAFSLPPRFVFVCGWQSESKSRVNRTGAVECLIYPTNG
jgi:hypothetical protein